MSSAKILSVLLIFICSSILAQDLIVRKGGENIYCKIIKQDSTATYYKKPGSDLILEIKQSQISKVFISPISNSSVEDSISNEIFIIRFFSGYANSLGAFASKNLNDKNGGLANNGFVINPSVILKLSDNFGVGLSYLYQSHHFNDATIRNYYTNSNPGYTYLTTSTPWKIRGFFAGMHFNFPLKRIEGLYLYLDVAGGVPKYISPQLMISERSNNSNFALTQFSDTTKSPTLFTGLGFEYKLKGSFKLNLSANYLMGKPSFSFHIKTSTGFSGYDSYTQPVKALNIQGGISFLVYKKRKSGKKRT
ncbi:MAG: hypothetical protein JWO32_786 [Bacteroidetes bacterium]|nr:hypothetical protein [Bacteroidota bacterium]